MHSRKLLCQPVLLTCTLVAVVCAQEPGGALNPPVPLAQPTAAEISPGTMAVSLAAAKRAQELGLPAVAVIQYRRLIAAAEPPARPKLVLAMVTALLDDGQADEAVKSLGELPEPRGAAWHLRAGIAAAQLKRPDAARLEAAAVKPEELSSEDLAWLWFLQGVLADMAPVQDITKANEFYNKAKNAAPTELLRIRFQLAIDRLRLGLGGKPSPATLEATRRNYEQFQGRAAGYEFVVPYAVMLDAAGRTRDAMDFLQTVLMSLPASERARADSFRFHLGLIAYPQRDPVGRRALVQLVEAGGNPELQREALQLLADASQAGPVRGGFRAELRKLADARPPHPIRETVLLFSAQAALADKDYKQAEDDANELLQKFPGSALRVHAYGVLTGSAWEQGRFRLAAANARQARAELATDTAGTAAERTEARAKLGVLEAEALFRAGDLDDFRGAADAYGVAARERPEGVKLGDLMFQRVLAEMKSGSPAAAKVLDEAEADPAFDPQNRWGAEWNLARELQTRGAEGVKEAYARVNRLLAGATGTTGVPPELRARLAWLQARLSLEAGEPERTMALADELARPKAFGDIDAALQTEIASMVALLKAEANFQLGRNAANPKLRLERETAALEILKKLRTDYPKSSAAVSSYLAEADYDVSPGQDKFNEAQKLLTKLAEDFPDNPTAPYALFKAALLAERLGQDDNFLEANRLIVDHLLKKYPASELVFAAMLKEGALLEKLGQLPQAQRVYQELENKFPRHREVTRAQLALAECLNAQAAANPAYLDEAQARFEQLRNRVDAPVDVRVEAGFNLGELLVRRKSLDQAIEVWWHEVVYPFLIDDAALKAQLLEPRVQGRYWMARTLVRLGEVLEEQGKLEDAKRAWSLVVETKLGVGESLAKERLLRAGVPETKP